MQETILPVGIQSDIDEVFCYREDKSYQDRAHEYLERYEVSRGYRDTAVQATVTDIARRAFEAGAQGCSGGGRPHCHRGGTARSVGEVPAGSPGDRSATMKDRKFVKVEQQLSHDTTTWLIDLATVVRLHPDSRYVVFDDGGAMNLTEQSTQSLVEELEGLA